MGDIKKLQLFRSLETADLDKFISKFSPSQDKFIEVKKVQSFKCPVCKKAKYSSMKLLENHVIKEHSEEIPLHMPVDQFLFNLRNKKTHGTCVICGNETNWNPAIHKYHRFCSDRCKDKYIKIARDRLKKTHGTDNLAADPEHQRKMLQNRKISKVYKYKDGSTINCVGSYEYDFIKYNDEVLGIDSKTIQECTFEFRYFYNEKEHFYIPDYYIPSLNLLIEIKDKGNTHPNIAVNMKAMDVKKFEEVIRQNRYNFIVICGKEYEEYVKFIEYLSNRENNENDKNKFIVEIPKDVYSGLFYSKESINQSQEFFNFGNKKESYKTITVDQWKELRSKIANIYENIIKVAQEAEQKHLEFTWNKLFDHEHAKKIGLDFKFFATQYRGKFNLDKESFLSFLDKIVQNQVKIEDMQIYKNYEKRFEDDEEAYIDEEIKDHITLNAGFYQNSAGDSIDQKIFDSFHWIRDENGKIIDRKNIGENYDETKPSFYAIDDVIDEHSDLGGDSGSHIDEMFGSEYVRTLEHKIYKAISQFQNEISEFASIDDNNFYSDWDYWCQIGIGLKVRLEKIENSNDNESEESLRYSNEELNMKRIIHSEEDMIKLKNIFISKLSKVFNKGLKESFIQLALNPFIEKVFSQDKLNQLNEYLKSINKESMNLKQLQMVCAQFVSENYNFATKETINKRFESSILQTSLKDTVGDLEEYDYGDGINYDDIENEFLSSNGRSNLSPWNATHAIPFIVLKDEKKTLDSFYKNQICSFDKQKPGFFSKHPPKIDFSNLFSNRNKLDDIFEKEFSIFGDFEDSLNEYYFYFMHCLATEDEYKQIFSKEDKAMFETRPGNSNVLTWAKDFGTLGKFLIKRIIALDPDLSDHSKIIQKMFDLIKKNESVLGIQSNKWFVDNFENPFGGSSKHQRNNPKKKEFAINFSLKSAKEYKNMVLVANVKTEEIKYLIFNKKDETHILIDGQTGKAITKKGFFTYEKQMEYAEIPLTPFGEIKKITIKDSQKTKWYSENSFRTNKNIVHYQLGSIKITSGKIGITGNSEFEKKGILDIKTSGSFPILAASYSQSDSSFDVIKIPISNTEPIKIIESEVGAFVEGGHFSIADPLIEQDYKNFSDKEYDGDESFIYNELVDNEEIVIKFEKKYKIGRFFNIMIPYGKHNLVDISNGGDGSAYFDIGYDKQNKICALYIVINDFSEDE